MDFFSLSTGIKFWITSTEGTIPNPVGILESGSFSFSNQAMDVAVKEARLVEKVYKRFLKKLCTSWMAFDQNVANHI